MRYLALALWAASNVCNPDSVPAQERCTYVRRNADVCWPEGGLQRYLEVHECWFSPAW